MDASDHVETGDKEDVSSEDHRPPPDRPGAEGYPSRADSRKGAAAANSREGAALANDDAGQAGAAETDGEGDAAGPAAGTERTGASEPTGESEAGEPTESPHERSPWKYGINVREMPLEEFLDRTAGNYGQPGIRDQPAGELPEEAPDWVEMRSDLPAGEELRDMDSAKLSRFERIRKEGYRKLNDALDVTEKGFDLGAGAFARPPTHAETRSPQPHVIEAPTHAITVGEAATGLLAAGVVLGEMARVGRERLAEMKRERNAGNE